MYNYKKWLNHSLFTSRIAGSILSRVFLMAIEPSPYMKSISQRSVESRRFSPGALASSHRKLTGWVK